MSEGTSGSGFSKERERILAAVLDEIIPPSRDGRLPGAGELGLAGYVAQRLSAEIERGLAALDAVAQRRGAREFAKLPTEQRPDALRELADADPGFLPGVIFHAYAGYYQDARVVAALGVETWPPHPDGYVLAPGDFTLLDEVRRRSKRYREDR